MPCVPIQFGEGTAFLTVVSDFKPGDLPPDNGSYLDWHEWAEVQRRAGIKQVECGRCGRWQTPQELSKTVVKTKLRDRGGRVVRIVDEPVCTKCHEKTVQQ